MSETHIKLKPCEYQCALSTYPFPTDTCKDDTEKIITYLKFSMVVSEYPVTTFKLLLQRSNKFKVQGSRQRIPQTDTIPSEKMHRLEKNHIYQFKIINSMHADSLNNIRYNMLEVTVT